MQDIAEKFNIPRYCLFASPAHFLSLIYHLPSFNAQGLIPIKLDAKPLMIPNFPPILPSDLPPSQHAEGVRPNSHLFLKNQSEQLWKSAGVLVNTVYELESGVIEGLQKYLKDGSKTTKVSIFMQNKLAICNFQISMPLTASLSSVSASRFDISDLQVPYLGLSLFIPIVPAH